MYEDAKKRGQVGLNKSQLDPLVQQYFKTYCIPTNRSVSEFMQLFFLDRQQTVDYHKRNQKFFKSIKKKDKSALTDDEWEKISSTDRNIKSNRYFRDEEVRQYFFNNFSTFITKSLEFEDPDLVEGGYAYFLNVTIPMSERFYASGYLEAITGLDSTELAIKAHLDKKITTLDKHFRFNTDHFRMRANKFFKSLFRDLALGWIFSRIIQKKERSDNKTPKNKS